MIRHLASLYSGSVARSSEPVSYHLPATSYGLVLPVALTATLYNFDTELADIDRGVYQTLALRLARHPSETQEFMLTRLLAYCLEYTEGIEFSRGVRASWM